MSAPDSRSGSEHDPAKIRDEILAKLEKAGFPIASLRGLEEPHLTTSQVAILLNTTDRTIRTWASAGKIRAVRSLGGRRLFPASVVVAAMESMVSGAAPDPNEQQTQG